MVLPIVFVIKYSTIIFYIHRSYNVAIVIEHGLNIRIRSAHAAAAKKLSDVITEQLESMILDGTLLVVRNYRQRESLRLNLMYRDLRLGKPLVIYRHVGW